MVVVPHEVMTEFVNLLRVRGIPQDQVEYHRKWLRYYFDFAAKYLHEQDQSVKVKLFLDKLKSKGQSSVQCQQAAHAVGVSASRKYVVSIRSTPTGSGIACALAACRTYFAVAIFCRRLCRNIGLT